MGETPGKPALPALADDLVYAQCAREEVGYLPERRDDIIVVTAADIFG
jgi:hypothetical protein